MSYPSKKSNQMKNSTGLFYVTAFVASVVLFYACKEKAEIPSLQTTAVSAITSTSATSGGNVISEFQDLISERRLLSTLNPALH